VSPVPPEGLTIAETLDDFLEVLREPEELCPFGEHACAVTSYPRWTPRSGQSWTPNNWPVQDFHFG